MVCTDNNQKGPEHVLAWKQELVALRLRGFRKTLSQDIWASVVKDFKATTAPTPGVSMWFGIKTKKWCFLSVSRFKRWEQLLLCEKFHNLNYYVELEDYYDDGARLFLVWDESVRSLATLAGLW